MHYLYLANTHTKTLYHVQFYNPNEQEKKTENDNTFTPTINQPRQTTGMAGYNTATSNDRDTILPYRMTLQPCTTL